MKKDKNIQKKIIEIIKAVLGDRQLIGPESSIVDDLGADSLQVIELELAIEEEFDISFDMDGAEKEIFTFGDLLAFVAAGGNQAVWLEYLRGRDDEEIQRSGLHSLNYSKVTEHMISGGTY